MAVCPTQHHASEQFEWLSRNSRRLIEGNSRRSVVEQTLQQSNKGRSILDLFGNKQGIKGDYACEHIGQACGEAKM
ncbi:MAG TPA: hypothetical protein DCL15_19925 [Chloroflexi bacterium]|nr:hypothetical protein [Chloroflexota bacterium]